MNELIFEPNFPLFNPEFKDDFDIGIGNQDMQISQLQNDGNLMYSFIPLPVTNDSISYNSFMNCPTPIQCQNLVNNNVNQVCPPLVYVQYVPQPPLLINNATPDNLINMDHQMMNLQQNMSPNMYQCNVPIENGNFGIFSPPISQTMHQMDYEQYQSRGGDIIDISKVKGKETARPREKKFPCPFEGCSLIIKRKDDLARHLRTHSGEKPFLCPTCQKGFSRKDHLRSHQRTHTKERPYICPTCQKGFARSDERKRHMKTHLNKNKKNQNININSLDGVSLGSEFLYFDQKS